MKHGNLELSCAISTDHDLYQVFKVLREYAVKNKYTLNGFATILAGEDGTLSFEITGKVGQSALATCNALSTLTKKGKRSTKRVRKG